MLSKAKRKIFHKFSKKHFHAVCELILKCWLSYSVALHDKEPGNFRNPVVTPQSLTRHSSCNSGYHLFLSLSLSLSLFVFSLC